MSSTTKYKVMIMVNDQLVKVTLENYLSNHYEAILKLDG